MYKIATLNKISPVGLERFTGCYSITDDPQTAEGIIVRSHPMHDMDFPDDLMAIARAGAGVNNIPTEKCAEKGIVVFNTRSQCQFRKRTVSLRDDNGSRNIPAVSNG